MKEIKNKITWKSIDNDLCDLEKKIGLPDFDNLYQQINSSLSYPPTNNEKRFNEMKQKLSKAKILHDKENFNRPQSFDVTENGVNDYAIVSISWSMTIDEKKYKNLSIELERHNREEVTRIFCEKVGQKSSDFIARGNGQNYSFNIFDDLVSVGEIYEYNLKILVSDNELYSECKKVKIKKHDLPKVKAAINYDDSGYWVSVDDCSKEVSEICIVHGEKKDFFTRSQIANKKCYITPLHDSEIEVLAIHRFSENKIVEGPKTKVSKNFSENKLIVLIQNKYKLKKYWSFIKKVWGMILSMRGDTKKGTLGRIDQYEIIRKLGGGGFGVVYLVRDTQSDVEYAIKAFHPLLKSNLEEMENLRSQFKLVSKLNHSHIASAMILHTVREVVYSSEDVRKELRLSPDDFVMVMKYAPGVTLSQWRKQFPNGIVPVDKAIDICKQVASALDYAHSEKIIHRDIKPSNIMVETRRDGATIARVLDSGMAAEIRSSMSRVSTEKGDTSGTRLYMAPEQWQGKEQGAATDQYALACMFYELVSGAVPFAGAFKTGDSIIMTSAVKNELPDSLDELTVGQNNAVLKALSKDMKQRFASCGELIAALSGETSAVNQLTQNQTLTPKTSIKTVKCLKCGIENSIQSKFCSNCGEKVIREDICASCGAELNEGQKFCPECGSKTPKFIALEKAEAERKAREKAVAEAKAKRAEAAAKAKIAEAEAKAKAAAEAAIKAYETFEAERKAREKVEAEGKISVAGIDMIRIPDSAKHKGLYFGKYQVTQAQWQAIMGNNPSCFTGDSSRPVEKVSWNDCQEFIKKLNARAEVKQAGITFRLPTEDEWEYACRAGSTGKYGLLADGREGTLDEMGWYKDNSRGKTHPVGQKKPNAWWLYDMHGNVWEWTASAYGSERFSRGGSYYNDEFFCKSGSRNWLNPEYRSCDHGFRLAASRTTQVLETEHKAPMKTEVELKVSKKAELEREIFVAGIEMVRIPDNTTHKGLYFGKYQVTQAQWQSVMGNNPSHFKGDLSLPVEQVSWNDCQEFIKKLNALRQVKLAGYIFRLPTVKEWEYACRAGSTGKYGLLANGREGTLEDMAWYDENSGAKTHPVGLKKPNAWGLYDMHGNVWELTSTLRHTIEWGNSITLVKSCGWSFKSNEITGEYANLFSKIFDMYGSDVHIDYTEESIGFRLVAQPQPLPNQT